MNSFKKTILLSVFAFTFSLGYTQDWKPTKQQDEKQRLDSINRANEQKRQQEERDRIAREQERKREQAERERIARENDQKRQQELMRNINTALEKGNCNEAQKNYDEWKSIEKNASSDIEFRIKQCKEPIMALTLQPKGKTTIYLAGSGSASINWGDGTSGQSFQLSAYNNSWDSTKNSYSHTYSNASTCKVIISGDNITHLSCTELGLTNIDVSKNLQIKYLACYYNQLKSIDVSKNTLLKEFYCFKNQLTSLDISKNTLLDSFDCSNNQLTSLDISKNTALKFFDCSNNQLTNLEVSNYSLLSNLFCSKNQLSTTTLNSLFNSLLNNKEKKKIICVSDNPGVKSCQKNIVEDRGWLIDISDDFPMDLFTVIDSIKWTYSNKKNYPIALKYNNVLIGLLIRYKEKINYKSSLARIYGGNSWYYLFTKEYNQSEQSARHAWELDSTQLVSKTNLAHALLFQNHLSEAEKIYRELSKSIFRLNNKKFDIIFLEDFDELEKAGAIPVERKNDVEKIRKMLRGQ